MPKHCRTTIAASAGVASRRSATASTSGLEPMMRLAAIAHSADTGHLEIVPKAAGLLAVSLGLSRMYSDDLEQLEAAMPVYNALYRWCRDATDKTHNWTSHTTSKGRTGGKS